MTDRPNVIKKNAWVCKVLPTHRIPAESHVRLKSSSTMPEFLSLWTTSPYASESRFQYQKWQFALDKIDNVFTSLVFFRAILEARWRWKVEVSVPSPPATEKTNGVKVLCSTFIILLLYNSFSYLACAWKEFFQQAYFSVSQN